MAPSPDSQAESRTLAERLAEGRFSVSEALAYSALLAEALRSMHEEGCAHGAVTPDNISVTASGLELLPPAAAFEVTPYTAPEALAGKPANPQSDIFSLGAVLYEMVTGRKAFEGEDAAALASAIGGSAPPPTGVPPVDGFLMHCLAKDCGARFPRMQRVLLELKLIRAMVQRAEHPPAARRATEVTALRAEVQEMEARIAARLQEQQAAASAAACAADDAVNGLRSEVSGLRGQLAAAQQQAVCAERSSEAAVERALAGMEQALAPAAQRLDRAERNLESLGKRLSLIEQGFDALRQQFSALQQNAAAGFQDLGRELKAQSAAIESLRSDAAQTDDLVERVVEALELLPSNITDKGFNQAQ
jgi:predicted  nucleic acid-binding Zn-ribbon protein